ncbi:MAG TPA: hypothetical protein VFO51_04055 [Sphingomicrobium sp.]|nr:hypothetical protein [Sphingomicrobium sp.]
MRTIKVFFAEGLASGLWAMIDAQFVAQNAIWFAIVSALGLIGAWFYEQISEFIAWKRGAHLPAPQPEIGVPPRAAPVSLNEFYSPTVTQQFELMPLKKAASEIFSEFHERLAGQLPNPGWDDPEKALGLCARVLLGDGLIPIWGVRAPGTWVKRIPEDDARSFQISGDASEMYDAINEKKRYTLTQIDKKDFARRRDELRKEYK